jgi:hypothetical protein
MAFPRHVILARKAATWPHRSPKRHGQQSAAPPRRSHPEGAATKWRTAKPVDSVSATWSRLPALGPASIPPQLNASVHALNAQSRQTNPMTAPTGPTPRHRPVGPPCSRARRARPLSTPAIETQTRRSRAGRAHRAQRQSPAPRALLLPAGEGGLRVSEGRMRAWKLGAACRQPTSKAVGAFRRSVGSF